MIFFLLNILLGVGIIFFSMYIDLDEREARSKALTTMILAFAVEVFFVISAFIALFWKNTQLMNITCRLMQFGYSLFAVSFMIFIIQYPKFEFRKIYNVIRYFFLAVAVALIWQFDSVSLSAQTGINVVSSPSFIFDIKWYTLYRIIYVMFIPTLSVLIIIANASRKILKIYKQQLLTIIIGMIFSVGIYFLLKLASAYYALYIMLFPYCLAVLLAMCYVAMRSSSMVDFNTIKSWLLKFLLDFAIPSLFAGFLFAILLPFRTSFPAFFWGAFIIGSCLLVILQRVIAYKVRKMQFSQGSNYEIYLEEKISAFDYNEEPEKLINDFVALMKQHTETMHVELLFHDDLGEIKSIHHSEGKESPAISTKASVIDSLSGSNRNVISKALAASRHEFSTYRDELLELFNSLNSELIILLREGRHLFGIISLGIKRHGNLFSDYDHRALNNLFSYLFLFGFYLKNIANQSVIGTVDREIQMSSQIIRSIQDNVDRINVPSIDVGYISQSARSLGGDFIDFIRLTDTRYMMIMGDVSGKGLNASMSMVILKSIIHTLLAETADFKELIEKVNYFIKYNLPRGTFFAGVFALFDFSANIMYYANCGLPVLFLYTEAYNNVIEIQGDGKVLGFAKKVGNMIKVKTIKLNPGDIVLACTDGLLDSVSLRGELYGKDRVQQLILDNKTFDSARMVQFVYDDLLQFVSKEVQDDVTIVSLRILKPQA